MTAFDNIKKYAKQRGMSLQEVATASGLSKNMIYQYKKMNPKLDTLKEIAKVLNVSINDLIGKEKPKEHLNVEPILNATQLYFKNTSLSEHDTAVVKNLLRSFLESEEGQQRLRDRGYTGKEKEDK